AQRRGPVALRPEPLQPHTVVLDDAHPPAELRVARLALAATTRSRGRASDTHHERPCDSDDRHSTHIPLRQPTSDPGHHRAQPPVWNGPRGEPDAVELCMLRA